MRRGPSHSQVWSSSLKQGGGISDRCTLCRCRERSGWIANCTMSCIFTFIWVVILSSRAYNNSHHGNKDVICTIDGCISG
jgi:hypothetical protein